MRLNATNIQGKLQSFSEGLKKLGFNKAVGNQFSENEMASIFDKADKNDGKQDGSVSDKDLADVIRNSSAYDELSSDEASYALDLMQDYESGFDSSIASNPFSTTVSASNPLVDAAPAFHLQAPSGVKTTGWENMQAVKLTGSETIEELRQGKEDTEDKLEEAGKSVSENEAVDNAQKAVLIAKSEYERAITDFENQKEAQIRAKNTEITINNERIKTQKNAIFQTEQAINDKSQEIAVQNEKLAKHKKAKPSISDYQTEEVDEEGNVTVYTDYQAYRKAMKKWQEQKEKIEKAIAQLEEDKKELQNKLKEQKQTLAELNEKNAKIKKEIQQLRVEKAQKNSQEISAAKENYERAQRELNQITQRASSLQNKARNILAEDLDTYVTAISGKEEDDKEKEEEMVA